MCKNETHFFKSSKYDQARICQYSQFQIWRFPNVYMDMMIDLNWWFWQTFKSRATQYSLSSSGWTLDFMRTPDTAAATCLHAATRAQRAAGSRAHSGIWEGCSIINYHPYLGWFILDTSSVYMLRHYLTVSCHTMFSCARVPPIPESCTTAGKWQQPRTRIHQHNPAQCSICSFIHFQFSSCCHLPVISPRPSTV